MCHRHVGQLGAGLVPTVQRLFSYVLLRVSQARQVLVGTQVQGGAANDLKPIIGGYSERFLIPQICVDQNKAVICCSERKMVVLPFDLREPVDACERGHLTVALLGIFTCITV